MKPWLFYGRQQQLADVKKILQRDRWFFAKLSGRRRIGKTRLIQEALQEVGSQRPTFYVQIPDSELIGVLSVVHDAMETFRLPADQYPRPRDAIQLAKMLENLARNGYIVVLDEFQYFNRKVYTEFCSLLQAAVDRLAKDATTIRGGWIVLGSLHNEMSALLEDRSAPLYNRVTDSIEIGHLEISAIAEILQAHADADSDRLLFLWNLFEGVPKFYRDCYEEGVLHQDRHTLIRRIFFESSSPLKNEAENWFLKELRGRYDIVLKTIARHPGKNHKELIQLITDAGSQEETQIGAYLKILIERYQFIERKLPILSKENARKARYYLTDNFLRSWLAALVNLVSATSFRPLDQLVQEADQNLFKLEGFALEKLVRKVYEEKSRKSIGDFSLTQQIQGYWDKSDVEIDFIAIDESNEMIRFGSCKRSSSKLLSDVNNFKIHVSKFLEFKPQFQSWTKQYFGITTKLTADHRKFLGQHDVIGQDLADLLLGLV